LLARQAQLNAALDLAKSDAQAMERKARRVFGLRMLAVKGMEAWVEIEGPAHLTNLARKLNL
jgi:hypothetical protein